MSSYGTVTDEELMRGLLKDLLDLPPWLEKQGAELLWMSTGERAADAVGHIFGLKVADGTPGVGKDILAFLHGVLSRKGIPVKLATPANGLVQDLNTREVLGVRATDSRG
jgi:hypothetical protein